MIGIITAFRHELAPMLAGSTWHTEKVGGRLFYQRTLSSGTELVATSSGLGKVMASATTQLLISSFAPRLLINFGSCGGLAPGMRVGDAVLASSVIEYDFDSLHKASPRLECEPSLVELLGKEFPFLKIGPLASADQNADTPEKRAWIHDQFQALAADWEGAAVVRVAHRNRLPALVVRGVTDVGDDDLSREYAAHAAHVLAEMSGLLENIIVAIDEQLHRGRQR
jgi:adenosylhomocysteine nucleosidase